MTFALVGMLEAAMTNAAHEGERQAVYTLNQLHSYDWLGWNAAFAAMLLATGLGARRNRMLPAPLAWATIAIGASLLTPIGFFGFILLPVWLIVVGAWLSRSTGRVPAPVAILAGLEGAARLLERLERDPAAGVDVGANRRLRRRQVAGGERVHDRAVLDRQVRARLQPAAADHLHHQVDRELPVEAREERVAGEVDLMLVEGRVRGVPLLVGDGRGRRLQQLAEPLEARSGDPADGCLGRVQLERPADVVALDECRRGQRVDVVAAARLDREQALGDEPGEGVVDGAAGDAEIGGELVQAELRARSRAPGGRAGASDPRRPARSGSPGSPSRPRPVSNTAAAQEQPRDRGTLTR